MAELHIPLFKWQQEIANDPHPVCVCINGRATGKSFLRNALITKAGVSAKGHSTVVLPTRTKAKEESRFYMADENISRFFKGDPVMWPDPIITYRNTRHWVDWRSFEKPKRLRGGQLGAGCVIITDESNDLDIAAVRAVLFPKLIRGTGRIIMFGSITHDNEWYALYRAGQDPSNKLIKSWCIPTTAAPQYQGEDGQRRLSELRAGTDEMTWNSEYLCIPNQDQQTAFPKLDRCIVQDQPPTEPRNGHSYVAGLDVGRVRDYTVIVVFERETGLLAYAERFERGLDHAIYAHRAGQIARFWGAAPVVIDRTGDTDAFFSAYQEHVQYLTPWYWSPNSNDRSKRDTISLLMLRLEQRKLLFPAKFKFVIDEMKNYRVLATKSQIGFGCTVGHDDAVSAVAMANVALHHKWGKSDPTPPLQERLQKNLKLG